MKTKERWLTTSELDKETYAIAAYFVQSSYNYHHTGKSWASVCGLIAHADSATDIYVIRESDGKIVLSYKSGTAIPITKR